MCAFAQLLAGPTSTAHQKVRRAALKELGGRKMVIFSGKPILKQFQDSLQLEALMLGGAGAELLTHIYVFLYASVF